MDGMVALVVIPSAASGTRRVRISVPLVEPLLDGRKYFREVDLPAAEGLDLRAMARPELDKLFGRPDKPPRRGALWTSHDNRTLIKRRLR